LRLAAWAVAGLALALGAIGLLGGVWPPADFLNQFAPVWAIAGLASVAVLFGVSRATKTTAVIAAGLAATATILMGPEFAARLSSDWAAAPAGVRILQFNVWKSNQVPSRAAAWVTAQQADFVVLEEAAGNGSAIASRLARQYP